MAEPARQLGPYDTESGNGASSLNNAEHIAAPGPSRNFGVIQGGREGDGKPAAKGKLSTLPGGKDDTGAAGRNPLNTINSGVAGAGGGLYNPSKEVLRRTGGEIFRGLVTGKNKRKSIIGGVGVSIVTLIAIGFLLFLPNEVISLMTQLENRYFGVATHDLDKMSEHLVSDYVKHRIFKQEGGDGKTATEDPIEGKDGLFDNWDKSNLKQQFADKGINFTTKDGKYLITSTDLPGGELDVTDFVNSDNTDLFSYLDKVNPTFANTLRTVKETILVTQGSWLHNIVTNLLAKRFGTKWCIMDCDPGNEQQDRAGNTLQEDQEFLPEEETDRTISAYQTEIVPATECLADENCDPTNRQAQSGDASTDVTAGEPMSAEDLQATAALDSVSTKFGSAKLAKLLTAYGNLKAAAADAMAKALAEALSGAIGSDISAEAVKDVASKVVKAINIAGWVQLIASAIVFTDTIATKIIALNYSIHSAVATQEFSMFATAADEQKSGYDHPQADELGSIGNGLSANGATATSSPLVQTDVDPNNPNNPTQPQVASYVDKGSMALNDYDGYLTGIAFEVQNDPQFSSLAPVAKLVSRVLGIVLAPINDVLLAILNHLGISGLINKAILSLLQLTVTSIFPMPNLANMSGRTRGTLVAEGADVSGNYAAEMLGGKAITTKAALDLVAEQQNVDKQQFQNRPLFARMFATDTPYSFVSRLSLEIPSNNLATMLHLSLVNLLQNPLSKLVSSFSTIIHPGNVFAASNDSAYDNSTIDPVGVTQYGIPDSDPVFSGDDLSAYWQSNSCTQQSSKDYPDWNKAVTLNLQNGQSDHTTTNGCLLVQRTVQALESSPSITSN